MMKYLFTSLISLLFVCGSLAQIVTTDPSIPVVSQSVKVYFDATYGTQGLMGFTGDVYAHTGVITDKSTSGSDWKYVKTNWGQNTPETKLIRIGTDLYELQITPSIRDYYGVPQSETILQMAFVFRSADTSKEGKDDGGTDIFVDVYSGEFTVQIISPEDNSIVESGTSLPLQVSTTEDAQISLFVNDEKVAETQGSFLEFDYTFDEQINYWIISQADNSILTVSDTLLVCVRKEAENIPLPGGYRKGINYLDDEKVAMVLWAPDKDYVFVMGDFNQWRPNNDFLMNRDGDYFWLEIDGLEPGKPYVYQYLIDGNLLLADPYTNQVSDPFNDKHIPASIYPGLVSYPYQKTYGMASVLQTAQQVYDWEVTDFQAPQKEKLVIYELLVRDFTEEHSYASVTGKLDYLEQLGVNVLELMPVNEFEGNSSWGYNPSFYFAPDKYYGPADSLKFLIDECHKRGIAVIIDMVLNHSYGQSPFVQMYFEEGKPAMNNPWYNQDHNFTNPDAHWGYDFNHESEHTQELVDSINAFWMHEFKIDGFRFDFTKGFGNNVKTSSDPWGSNYDPDRIRLLKRMSDEIWKRNEDALVIFEHLAENSEEKVLADHGIMLWGNMHHDYKEAAMGYDSNFGWGIYSSRGWNQPNLVSYMESHDEERIMYDMSLYGASYGSYSTKDPVYGAHRIGLNALFFLPLPGPKMIWQFGELGYDISINYGCRLCEKPILWEYFEEWQRKNIYDIMANLNELKNSEDIFIMGDLVHWLSGDVKQYRFSYDGNFVVAVGNFDVKERASTVNLPASGTWYEYFTRTEMEVTDLSLSLNLLPGEYRLFSTIPFEWKTDMSPLKTKETQREFKNLQVYPNPAEDIIRWDLDMVSIQVFDQQGRMVIDMYNDKGINQLDLSAMEPGIYLILGADIKGELYHKRVSVH